MAQENLMQSIDRQSGVMHQLRSILSATIFRARQRFLQGFLVFSVIFLLLWIAAFLYGSFYYTYMPKATYYTPVHYYYSCDSILAAMCLRAKTKGHVLGLRRTNCESPDSFRCSYPVANVSLMKNKNHVLTFGQAYRLSLLLEMPESPVNQDLGMFVVRTTCFSQDGGQVASSAHTLHASSSQFGILRYRSDLVKNLETLLLLPAFLTGTTEQKQVLEVELFSDYTDDPYAPSDTALIEILSRKVQIYSSQLLVNAHFTGLRYLLFNFPLISALVGISTNFLFLSALFVFSYLRQMLKLRQKPEESVNGPPPARGEECVRDSSG